MTRSHGIAAAKSMEAHPRKYLRLIAFNSITCTPIGKSVKHPVYYNSLLPQSGS